MGKAKHTPGPWVSIKNTEGGFNIESPEAGDEFGGFLIGSAKQANGEANARLFAAAPEMLEALKGLVDYVGQMKNVPYQPLQDFLNIAVEAIEKAEGRES